MVLGEVEETHLITDQDTHEITVGLILKKSYLI